MDEFLDQYISSSSWCDVSALDQSNSLLANSLGEFRNDAQELPLGMITSRPSIDCLPSQDTTSIVIGDDSDYGLSVNSRVKIEDMADYASNIPSTVSFSAVVPFSSTTNLCSSKQVPTIDGVASFVCTKTGHFGCNGSQLYEIQRSLRDLPSLSTIPSMSHPSFNGGSLLSNATEADKIHGFGLQGGGIDEDVGSKYIEINKPLQFGTFSASVTTKGSQSISLPSFASGPLITAQEVKLRSLIQPTTITPGACNGTAKPRVRARRGQATDPHSIAERLRREKISERMKNLQELVPSSTKTDKASMLDEIIEYVKFLQLQVKVLSISRLGAVGAVVPLITDGHSEGSKGLSFLPSGGQVIEVSPSADQMAFEQEVVKLMETNVTKATQYLQSKGLCLMPITLATAISNAKASQARANSDEGQKSSLDHGLGHNNSSSSSNSSYEQCA